MATLEFGQVAGIVQKQLDRYYTNLQFTTNQLWENLETEDREELRAGYGDILVARRAIAGQLSAHSYIRVVKRHKRGETVWVYNPTGTRRPEEEKKEVGHQTTFTMVGFASDGSPLWRDDATGRLGWFEFKEL